MKGWLFPTRRTRRGLIVYLHGVADNRASSLGLARRFAAEGYFQVADVSPRKAAAGIHVPVLLIHGREDRETPAAHSQRIYDALAGPRRLLLVPGAGHNDVFSGADVWREIETWLAGLTARR